MSRCPRIAHRSYPHQAVFKVPFRYMGLWGRTWRSSLAKNPGESMFHPMFRCTRALLEPERGSLGAGLFRLWNPRE